MELNKKLKNDLGKVVQEGPFAGLVLPEEAFEEHVGPFLLGTYESELFPVWEIVFSKIYSQIIDIGSKFGFYAVGIGLKFPGCPVIAFANDPWAQKATRAMAEANSLPNVIVRSYCDTKWMEKNLLPDALLICDCEGFEKKLFSKKFGTNTHSLTAIVEIHDELVPGCGSAVRSFFENSHDLKVLTCHESSDPNGGNKQPRCDLAVKEIRGRQEWIIATPRQIGI